MRRLMARACMSASKLLFLATEDWFIRSHFMPLVRRAQAEGYDVAVAARVSDGLDGVRVIDMSFARGAFDPVNLARERAALRKLLRAERPDIVHAIALKSIMLLNLSGAQNAARVFALTGRGVLGASRDSIVQRAFAAILRRALDDERSALLVENEADRAWIEGTRPLPDARVALMPGAGVDPDRFTPQPEPEPPITVGVAARLVRSKGVDVAVEAVRRLQREGVSVHLRIAGEVDTDNPRAFSAATVRQWRFTRDVAVLGRVLDIPAFWASAHIACLPSRGGEGLPRSLLEAAACGRPIVTTSTPGCVDFVRDGHDGLIVAPDDPDALAAALRTLARDEKMRRAFGASARARVLMGYTEAHAADVAAQAWRNLLAR